MLSCIDVGKYFLAITDEDSGELISNLKLQKLVFYAQGFYLAKYGEPLFEEEIEAWKFGPVIPVLYQKYRDYGSSRIDLPTDVDFSLYSADIQAFLDEVYIKYGQFSAWRLSELTHSESIWEKYVQQVGVAIPKDELRDYFKTKIMLN